MLVRAGFTNHNRQWSTISKTRPHPTKNTNLHFPMRCKFQVDVGDRWWGAGLSRWLVIVRYCWWNPPLQNLGKGIVQKSLVFPAQKMYNIPNMGSASKGRSYFIKQLVKFTPALLSHNNGRWLKIIWQMLTKIESKENGVRIQLPPP